MPGQKIQQINNGQQQAQQGDKAKAQAQKQAQYIRQIADKQTTRVVKRQQTIAQINIIGIEQIIIR